MDYLTVRLIIRVVVDVSVLIAGTILLQFRHSFPVVKRGFFCDDETLMYPLKKSTVGNVTQVLVSVVAPVVLIIFTEILRFYFARGMRLSVGMIVFDRYVPSFVVAWYRYIVTFLFGWISTLIFTYVGKLTTGRLRPHFFDACKPDVNCTASARKDVFIDKYECLGSEAVWIKHVRLSFPSGHASTITFSMVYLAIYFHFRINWNGSRLVKPVLQIICLVVCWFVSLTRITDHHHHWSDVTVGIIMGALIAIVMVLALIVLSLIPWPGPAIFKISCPRDSATVVRRIIQKKWIPVLEKYQVKVPVECPFHPRRDIFWPQQAAKRQHRPSQWTCSLCGKSFYSEAYLDMHFDNRHKNVVNMAEDAVCLADYCDIMRCDVVRKHIMSELTPGHGMSVNTDIEIWREATSYHTALSPAGPRDLARVSPYNVPFRHASSVGSNGGGGSPSTRSCSRGDGPPGEGDGNSTGGGSDSCDNLVDSAVPPKHRMSELQRLKANCKPEILQKLKTRCEILVRDCIAGLLVNLSTQDFQDVEEELNQAVCWYLTCDRYWEDSPVDLRSFPWGLLFVLVMALSLFICLCYYIVWVLFDSDDMSVASTSATASSSPARHSHYSEDYYPVSDDLSQNEHYIYVTYPPDLKRRLLESLILAKSCKL